MAAQDNEPEQRVVAVVVTSVIVLIVGAVLAVGVFSVRGHPPASKPAAGTAAMAPAAAIPAARAPSASDASVVVDSGVVTFYFSAGKADLAPGALAALGEAIAAAQGGARIVVSGFHDATGDPASNAALARQRALAVHDALLSAGVPHARVELKKPEVSTGSGANAEARRVEVTTLR